MTRTQTTVQEKFYLDGKLKSTRLVTRMVYQPVNGKWYVNCMNNRLPVELEGRYLTYHIKAETL